MSTTDARDSGDEPQREDHPGPVRRWAHTQDRRTVHGDHVIAYFLAMIGIIGPDVKIYFPHDWDRDLAQRDYDGTFINTPEWVAAEDGWQ